MWGKVVSYRHSGVPAKAGEPGIHTHDALDLRYGMCRALIPEACKNPCEERCDMADEVRPIRSKRDHAAALKEVERLWGAKAGTRDGDRLDVLVTLIEAYEEEHYPIDPPDPIEAIKFRMEQQGLTRRDLEEIIGTRTRIAEVLNRKRGLSIAMIRRLNERLGIPAEVLIRPSRKTAA
jgi:HTH-type transcriptional regulator/antitoxin HigA